MKHIHFIAIGGAIMHQLAIALKKEGYLVSGSDDEINDPARSNLAAEGILPSETGWFPTKITSSIDAVVLGMHAKAGNPELQKAKELGIPVYSFPQYVYEVSKDKQRIVIAGSHGKTTITSMVMHILRSRQMDFDYLVGARVEGFSQSVRLSKAPLMVLEGDEYPASVEEKRPKIFFYHPQVTVLSGIAWDHINVFPTYENYFDQFRQYLTTMGSGTLLIYNEEDPEVVRLVAEAGGHLNLQPYSAPEYHYRDGTAVLNTPAGQVEVSVFGRHNLMNLQAAVTVATHLNISQEDAYRAIAGFTGAAKRLEKVFQSDELVIFRDFAHAPSKLKATLDAVREAYPDSNLIACFELHTYSSLSDAFLSQYRDSMNAADQAVVYFSTHALELKGLPALQPEVVAGHFAGNGVVVVNEPEKLLRKVQDLVKASQKPTCLLLMSSGTFDGIDWNSVSSQEYQ